MSEQESKDEEKKACEKTASEVKQLVDEEKDTVYLRGLSREKELEAILKPLGHDKINEFVWIKLHSFLYNSQEHQLQGSLFCLDKKWNRFPDIYPYDFNLMPHYIGSWMGDCFGLMQWPLKGEAYNKLLQNVIVKNNVGMIVALGKQEKNENMISYWDSLGEQVNSNKKENCAIYVVEGISSKSKSCTVYHFENWADMDKPSAGQNASFNFLFEEVKKMEDDHKNVLIHCRAGVGRSGTFRLMYKAWKGEITSKNLLLEVYKQRALRMYTVQTKSQFIFLQTYVKAQANLQGKNETILKNYSIRGQEALKKKDFEQATFYWLMYGTFGIGRHYGNLDEAKNKCLDFTQFFVDKLNREQFTGSTDWPTVKKIWDDSRKVDEGKGIGIIELKNKPALRFWKENFGEEKLRVSNTAFIKAVTALFEEEKKKGEKKDYNASKDVQAMFTKGLAEQIFWPETGDLDNTTRTPIYVDKASVQFAINTYYYY